MVLRCPCCGILRNEEDFMGKEKCYKCIYNEKIKNPPETNRKCIICEERITITRWKYCSQSCADEGLDIRRKASHSKFWLRTNIEPNRRLRRI